MCIRDRRYTAGLAPDNLFRVIIGDEEVAQGVKAKPDPDAYLEACLLYTSRCV